MDRARTLNEDYSDSHSLSENGHENDEAVLGILRDEVANLRELLEQANFSGATEQTLNEIASLSGRIDSMSTLLGQERSDPKVQDALRDIHALLDKPAQDPTIDGHFDRILEKLDTLPLRNHDEEFAQLSSQLDMLRNMLNNAPQAQHFSSLEGQISNLADRLASLESNVRESQQQTPSNASNSEDLDYRLQSLQGLLEQLNPSDRLMRLEDQLVSLADRLEHGSDNVRGPLDALANQVESLASLVGEQGQVSQEKTFAALADRVAELDQRLREGQDSENRFDHVEQTLARIDDMLARQMETSGLSGIEDRLANLTQKLDQQASVPLGTTSAAFDPRALAGLEAQISGLADRLDAATRDPYDTAHFEALTSRLDSLAEQFDRSQSRFDAVDRLGQDIQRLAQQPQNTPTGGGAAVLEQTESLAEAAAMRALQQVGPLGTSSGDSTLDAILDGLKDDMHGLRQMAQAKEDATQQGLHSVSKTLNGIVDRLASLEDQVRKSERDMPPAIQMAQQTTHASDQPSGEQDKPAKGGLGRLLGRKKKKQTDLVGETPTPANTKTPDGKPLSAQQLLAQRAAMGRTASSPQATSASATATSRPVAHGGARPAPSIQLSGKAGNRATAAASSAPQIQPDMQPGLVEDSVQQQAAPAVRAQGAQIIRDDTGPSPQRNASGAASKADFIAAARRAAQAAARESEQAETDRSVAQSLMDRLKGKRKTKEDAGQASADPKGDEPKMNRKQRRAAVADAARLAKQNKADQENTAEALRMMADEAIDPAMASADARALLDEDQGQKNSLFSRIGQTVSRNSRPLLLAAAAILLAITTLQMAKNPESSLYALFNDTTPKVQAQSDNTRSDVTPGVLNGGNLAIDNPENLEPQITLPASKGAEVPKIGEGSSITPSSGSLVPDLVGEAADRAIAFSSPSLTSGATSGPTIEAGKVQQEALGPRRPEVVQDHANAQPQAGISGNAGIDLTPTSAINRSELPGLGQQAARQPMPKALNAEALAQSSGTSVSSAIQSAAQMNSLLSPGVSTSPIMTAADGGDSLAQFELGRRLTLGEGVSVDMKKAAEWFEKAANQSMPQAQYSLANLYEKGHGVKKDLMVARLWYERAAKSGNVKAMHNLAVILAEGGLGKPDFKQASDWFIKAADHGLKDSQYNLAILFARGMGVKQDLVQSYKWFAIAAHNGDRGATAKRDEVSRVLTGSQLKTAKAIVEAWIPKMAKPSANQVASIPDAWRVTAGAVPGQAGVKLVDPGKPSPDIIRQAQGMLSALGFKTGRPDGKIGPRTRTAIRNFQKSAGFPIDGKLSPALMQALAIRLG